MKQVVLRFYATGDETLNSFTELTERAVAEMGGTIQRCTTVIVAITLPDGDLNDAIAALPADIQQRANIHF